MFFVSKFLLLKPCRCFTNLFQQISLIAFTSQIHKKTSEQVPRSATLLKMTNFRGYFYKSVENIASISVQKKYLGHCQFDHEQLHLVTLNIGLSL